MKKTAVISSLLLFLAACIWGFAFVAQSVGMDYMGPLTFNGVRFLLGSLVLLPIVLIRWKAGTKKTHGGDGSSGRKESIKGGICCGLILCAASLLQQIGIQYTTVGKAGFITTLYIIIVPVLGLFLHKKVQSKVWFAAVMAAAGLYLLCANTAFTGEALLNKGDRYVFVCAILFSLHILVIDYFSPKADGIILSFIQFFTAGVICMAGAILFEQPSFSQLIAGAGPVLYAGIMSCGIAYTLQVIGQKNVEPAAASLILSLESAVSVLAGWVILGQVLSGKELFGCVLVFAAVLLVQLPDRNAVQTAADGN